MAKKWISKRSQVIGRTKIRMMYELETMYDDVVSFTVGEPDFHTPQHIVDACLASLENHRTGYAPNQGVMELRKAISERIAQTHGVVYDPETEIIVTAGGMNALRSAAEALFDPDDEVIISNPYWCNHMHHPLLEMAKAVQVPVWEKDNYMYDVESLEQYVTPKTKAIMLNSPSNPTGGVISKEQIEALCKFCIDHDLFLISDEVYEHIIYDDLKFYSPVMFENMRERTLICSSLSKSYAMTGWRLGYAAGPKEVIGAMLRINENTIASPTTFVQDAAVAALRGPQDARDAMVRTFEKRRDLLFEHINAIPGLRCSKPQGAFYAFVDIRGTGLSSEEFSVRLLKEQQVSVTPGDGFGSAGEGYVRMSYALSTELLLEGMKRIRAFVESL
ncbi:MAG: pyridoxal phosphate-dependent aminotransferase [Oscillospiraceae bacterium]|nr:pyridoxal phosphate-dependent aminotransferase [Oscillospiraceae bacterium]